MVAYLTVYWIFFWKDFWKYSLRQQTSFEKCTCTAWLNGGALPLPKKLGDHWPTSTKWCTDPQMVVAAAHRSKFSMGDKVMSTLSFLSIHDLANEDGNRLPPFLRDLQFPNITNPLPRMHCVPQWVSKHTMVTNANGDIHSQVGLHIHQSPRSNTFTPRHPMEPHIPNKVKIFLWLLAKNRLLTNSNLIKHNKLALCNHLCDVLIDPPRRCRPPIPSLYIRKMSLEWHPTGKPHHPNVHIHALTLLTPSRTTTQQTEPARLGSLLESMEGAQQMNFSEYKQTNRKAAYTDIHGQLTLGLHLIFFFCHYVHIPLI
jgi:hypothetical protein